MPERCMQILELCAWLLVAGMGTLALTQAFGWTGHPLAYIAQALTPYALAPAIPLAIAAMTLDRHALATVSAVIAVSLLWLSVPMVFHGQSPRPAADGVSVTIAHSNVYYRNGTRELAADALIDLGADVIALTEYSKQMGNLLRDRGIDDSHPYRLERAPGDRNGVALFSRYPIDEADVHDIGHELGIEATLDVDGTDVRILVVHPLPGTKRTDLAMLHADLSKIGVAATAGPVPTVVIGDFNTSWWHPDFRDLLRRGLTDAHQKLGRGFTVSWPAGRRMVPAFVRLDHALTTDGLVATEIEDADIPGSDHRAFVVTIATA